MKRKIVFTLQVADEFTKGNVGNLMSDLRFDTPIGNSEQVEEIVEFEWDEKEDIMKVAGRALHKQFDKKQYRIVYWDWMK